MVLLWPSVQLARDNPVLSMDEKMVMFTPANIQCNNNIRSSFDCLILPNCEIGNLLLAKLLSEPSAFRMRPRCFGSLPWHFCQVIIKLLYPSPFARLWCPSGDWINSVQFPLSWPISNFFCSYQSDAQTKFNPVRTKRRIQNKTRYCYCTQCCHN